MEFDHPDFFKDENDYIKSFQTFAENSNKVVVNENISHFFKNAITFGLSDNSNYFVKKIKETKTGVSFDVFHDGKILMSNVKIRQFGLFNVLNALAAFSLSHQNGICLEDIKKGLLNFKGIKRRFEFLGFVNSAYVYTDYAHHPSEVSSILTTCNTLKKTNKAKTFIVYEPHTYSRTKTFLNEYAEALTNANEIILTKIFAARETNENGFTSPALAGEISKFGKTAYYFENEKFILRYLNKHTKKNDLILFCGAGNIDRLAERFVVSNPSDFL